MKEYAISFKGLSEVVMTKIKELANMQTKTQKEIFEAATEDAYVKANLFNDQKKSLAEISRKNELGGLLNKDELQFLVHYNKEAYSVFGNLWDVEKLTKIKNAITKCFESEVDFGITKELFAKNIGCEVNALIERSKEEKNNHYLIMLNLFLLCDKFGDNESINKELNGIAGLMVENTKWFFYTKTDYTEEFKVRNYEFEKVFSFTSNNKDFDVDFYSHHLAKFRIKNTIISIKGWKNILELLNVITFTPFISNIKGEYVDLFGADDKAYLTLEKDIRIVLSKDDFKNIQEFCKNIRADKKYIDFENIAKEFVGYPV